MKLSDWAWTEPPKRIQRRRTKGWRMPEGAVCVTRPGKWGNPFQNVQGGTAMEAAALFYSFADQAYRSRARLELRGKDLACWCRLCDAHKLGKHFGVECSQCAPCHADVLLRLANT